MRRRSLAILFVAVGSLLLKSVAEGTARLLSEATNGTLVGKAGHLFSHTLKVVPIPRK